MDHKKSGRNLLVFLFFSAFLLAGPRPYVYLYIIDFDNLKNDQATDWLRAGFADMAREAVSENPEITVRNKNDLEEIMANRKMLLQQPRGSRNFLLLGKFDRQGENVKLGLQLINIATWEETEARKIEGKFSDIPALGKVMASNINSMLVPFLPAQKKSPYPEFTSPRAEKPVPATMEKAGMVTESIDIALENLEESMDLASGARSRKPVPEDMDSEGVWEMDLNVGNKPHDNPENAANTEMLISVIKSLTASPYRVRMAKPEFKYDKDDKGEMEVVFPVTYSLKENLIKDMLRTLPYTGLKQDGTLTIFYFSRDKFNFPENLYNSVRSGSHRSTPVIQFLDDEGKPAIVIADSPVKSVYALESRKGIKYISTHYFSPLMDVTIGGWSLQVAMETVNIPVKYRFRVPVELVKNMSRVRLEFVQDQDLVNYLRQLL